MVYRLNRRRSEHREQPKGEGATKQSHREHSVGMRLGGVLGAQVVKAVAAQQVRRCLIGQNQAG